MKGTTYAVMGSEKGGPTVAMGDHIRRHGRSQGDQVFCHRRSGGDQPFCRARSRSAAHGPGGTNFGGDQLSCDSAAHGPGGPILGGTNYRVTIRPTQAIKRSSCWRLQCSDRSDSRGHRNRPLSLSLVVLPRSSPDSSTTDVHGTQDFYTKSASDMNSYS